GVNALMIGTNDGNDDFEYYGHAQAVLIGGQKSNTLIGGQMEFGGGLPAGIYTHVHPKNFIRFPPFVQDPTRRGRADGFGELPPLLVDLQENPVVLARELVAGDGPDFLVGTAGADQLYAGSTNNTFNGLGGGDQVYGNAANDVVAAAGQTVNNIFVESAINN